MMMMMMMMMFFGGRVFLSAPLCASTTDVPDRPTQDSKKSSLLNDKYFRKDSRIRYLCSKYLYISSE